MSKVWKLTIVAIAASTVCLCLFYGDNSNTQAKPQVIYYNNLQFDANDQEAVKLIDILRNAYLQEKEPERVIKAILRLQELKSPLAIDELAKLVAFRRQFPNESPYTITESMPLFRRYPATEALVAIGEPALPALIKVIEENETLSKANKNALHTIMKIFKYQPAVVQYLREARQRTASDTESSNRLMDAINEAERFINVYNGTESESER